MPWEEEWEWADKVFCKKYGVKAYCIPATGLRLLLSKKAAPRQKMQRR